MKLRELPASSQSSNLLTSPLRSISIAEIKPVEPGADAVQPVELAASVAAAEPAASVAAAEPTVAAVPAEPAQEQKQDQSPDAPALSNGNGQSKALVPLEDNSPKKNGGTELAENNNNPSNVAEAEGQQKVR